jgi:hypothetical protein
MPRASCGPDCSTAWVVIGEAIQRAQIARQLQAERQNQVLAI